MLGTKAENFSGILRGNRPENNGDSCSRGKGSCRGGRGIGQGPAEKAAGGFGERCRGKLSGEEPSELRGDLQMSDTGEGLHYQSCRLPDRISVRSRCLIAAVSCM